MGKSQRQKGYRVECKIRSLHREASLECVRVPLSGAAADFKGDLEILGKYRAEVKARGKGQGFALIGKWLGDNDLLFLVADRQEPLVVLPWRTYKNLLAPDVSPHST